MTRNERPLRLGVQFPQTEIGSDPETIRTYAAAAEEAGYDHIVMIDHVIGADITTREPWPGPYTIDHAFHECLTTLAYLAGVTQMELASGVLILPQRQTVLVAKQAAEIDLLSRGRFRLGVGIGWNPVEYETLGADFTTRGARLEEQVALLRELWTKPSVNVVTQEHVLQAVGIRPLPVQQPIPIWMGAVSSERALRRVGRLADGFIATTVPGRGLEEGLALIRNAAIDAGRDPDEIGFEGFLPVKDDEKVREIARRWCELGVTHLMIQTTGNGFATVDGHIEALRRLAAALR